MHKPTARRQVDQLSPRERKVLCLFAEGHPTTAIATKLSLSPSTVEAHRTTVMRKLALHTDTELVRYALQQALRSDQRPTGK